jgi:YbbR domain-containing protein
MKNAFRWVISNLGLVILSLLLALLVWVVAVEQENPTIEQQYPSPVPIVFVGQGEDVVVYEQDVMHVLVTLRTAELVWTSLRLDDFHAEVDLSGLGDGQHDLPIQVSVDEGPAIIRTVVPADVTVRIERIAQAVVPVNLRIEGNTALGYVAQTAQVTPMSVTVEGPASQVAQVTQAAVEISVDGRRADIAGEFPLQAQDGSGDIVPHVDLTPARVAVSVPIEQLRGFQELAVTLAVEGQIAPGYRISNITVDPPVVTVYGSQDAIDAIAQSPGYLETAPLSVEGLWENVEERLALDLPSGVFLVGMDDPLVTARVTIVPEEGSVTLDRQVSIQGWSPGITATVAPTTVQVILSGPLPILDRLQEEDVIVLVDLFGRTPGSYSIEPRVVVVPVGVVADSVVPASVQLVIGVDETPTPTVEPDG